MHVPDTAAYLEDWVAAKKAFNSLNPKLAIRYEVLLKAALQRSQFSKWFPEIPAETIAYLKAEVGTQFHYYLNTGTPPCYNVANLMNILDTLKDENIDKHILKIMENVISGIVESGSRYIKHVKEIEYNT